MECEDNLTLSIVYAICCMDLKDLNAIKIGRCELWKDRCSTYITGYPYNPPKLRFVIKCKTKEESIQIENILHDEFDKYSTKKSENYNGGGSEWFSIPHSDIDINKIKEILIRYGKNNEILVGEELEKFEKEEKRKLRNEINKENLEKFKRKINKKKLKKILHKFRNN